MDVCQKHVIIRVMHGFYCNLLVSIWANACGLVVFRAVHVGAVVKGTVPPPYGSPSPLVQKMPVETSKGSVLRTLVLEEQRALLCPELLQVSENSEKGLKRKQAERNPSRV